VTRGEAGRIQVVGAVVQREIGVASGCQQGWLRVRKGRHKRLEQISSVEKRATNEGTDELQDVKEDSVAIEVGVEVDRSTSAGRGGAGACASFHALDCRRSVDQEGHFHFRRAAAPSLLITVRTRASSWITSAGTFAISCVVKISQGLYHYCVALSLLPLRIMFPSSCLPQAWSFVRP
jgi:hypothetical protein